MKGRVGLVPEDLARGRPDSPVKRHGVPSRVGRGGLLSCGMEGEEDNGLMDGEESGPRWS